MLQSRVRDSSRSLEIFRLNELRSVLITLQVNSDHSFTASDQRKPEGTND